MKKLIKKLQKIFARPCVSNYPTEGKSVLAKIEQIDSIDSLEKLSWYEVVYYCDKHWQPYAGSDTFSNDEKVVKWKYCKDCF